jgi:hypothetical protein
MNSEMCRKVIREQIDGIRAISPPEDLGAQRAISLLNVIDWLLIENGRLAEKMASPEGGQRPEAILVEVEDFEGRVWAFNLRHCIYFSRREEGGTVIMLRDGRVITIDEPYSDFLNRITGNDKEQGDECQEQE